MSCMVVDVEHKNNFGGHDNRQPDTERLKNKNKSRRRGTCYVTLLAGGKQKQNKQDKEDEKKYLE